MKRLLPFLALAVLCAASPARAQATAPLATYRADVDRLRARLTRAENHVEDHETGALREKLYGTRRVRMPGGQVVVLDTGPFAPGQTASDVRARVQTLSALLAPLAREGSTGDPRADAQAILSRPGFEQISDKPDKAESDNWFTRMMRAIGRAINNFFRWLFGSRPDAPQADSSGAASFIAALLRFLLFALIAVGIVWGGLWVFRRVSKNAPGKKRAGVLDEDDGEEILDALGTARERAARGELRQALRLAYIACLRRLAGSGLLVLQQSRTNWEYQSALRARSPEVSQTLLPATRLFDQVWYGKREATLAEFEQVMAIHDLLPEPLVGPETIKTGKTSGADGGKPGPGNDWAITGKGAAPR